MFGINTFLRPATAALALFMTLVPIARAGNVYDAVADYSLSANPNGTWSYLYDQSGSGPSLMTQTGAASGLPDWVFWWNGQQLPDAVYVTKNTSNSTITHLTEVLPTNLLNMDPQSETAITRWTAPSAGVWSMAGLFQGIDVDEHSHSVEILENGTTVFLSPTTISSFGQVVDFSGTLTLAKGDTLDFIVNTGTTYTDLSTGFDVTIQSAVPEPSSLVLGVLAILGVGGARWLGRRSHGRYSAAAREFTARSSRPC